MKISPTKISGVSIIESAPNEDERGYFSRIFCEEELARAGISFAIVQASHSLTTKRGTLRGVHFQKEPKAEDKIIQCLRGKIYDVVVDLRKDSPTFGKWIAEELSEDNKKALFIPRGCAHGFQTLVDDCLVQYFMNEFYSPEHASGVRWDDPFFKIRWPIENPILSEKDKDWPLMSREKAEYKLKDI